MVWATARLREVAPPSSADIEFKPDARVWNLSLDQIESETGVVTNKRFTRAEEVGSSTFSFDTDNVLYSKLRPYLNKVVLPDEPGIATTELIPLRPKKAVLDARFLTYYLRSQGFVNQVSHHVAGANLPRVVMDWFWRHEIPLPPMSEQQRIIELLDQADALRRLRREADAKAARILPVLFLKMFGDPAMNPMGWPTASIGELTTLVTSGSTPRGGAEVYVSEGPYIIRSQNVLMNHLRLSDAARITSETHEQMSRTWVFVGDVLLNITGASIGRVAWVKALDGPANVNQHVCIIRPNAQFVDPAYLSVCLSLPSMQSAIDGVQTGASRQALNHVQVRALEIPQPPVEIQRQFASHAWSLDGLLEQIDSANLRLESLWQSLVRQAFSGQLTAKWHQAHAKELLAEMQQQAKIMNLPMPQGIS